jgi:integrase/recombinase XerD
VITSTIDLEESIHRRQQGIEVLFVKAKSEMSEEDFQLMSNYDNYMKSKGNGLLFRYNQLCTFRRLTRDMIAGKWNWKDVDQTKLMELVGQIMDKNSDHGRESETSHCMKLDLRRIVRYVITGNNEKDLENGEPQIIKFLKSRKPKSKLTKEQLPTKEEITKLIDTCADSSRDKALFSLHAEAGNRIGETLSLKIKNFRVDEFGGIIEVNGKTGKRPVRIVKSVHYVAKWLNEHPFRNNPESPLFIYIENAHSYGKPVSYSGFQYILKKRLKHAGITKRTTSHLFRHASVTEWASKLTEAESRMRFGWEKNSSMPTHYAHLNQGDLDRKVLESYGIKPKVIEEESFNKCNHCNIQYPSEITFCEQCSRPIDLETAIQMEKESKSNQEALILEVIRKERATERKRKSQEGTQQVVKKQQEEIELLKQTIKSLSK